MARKRKKQSRIFFKIFFWLCFLISVTYFIVNFFAAPPHVFYPGFQIEIPGRYAIHGIDVSRYQGIINWKEVKEMEDKGIKIGFAFIKATEGVSNVDEQFRRNWIKASEQGIPKGAYHFFLPTRNAQKQADNFTGMVNLTSGDMPPVLDVEKDRGVSVEEMRKAVKTWLRIVENHYGVKPVIYTNVSFYEKYFQTGFEEYPLWIAHYLQPEKPRIGTRWTFWQHSEIGRVNGIKTPVDFNIFYGDSTAFTGLLIP